MDKIKDYFQQIWVISNPSNPEKFQITAEKLAKFGLEANEFKGVDKRILDAYVIDDFRDTNAMACTLSHLSLIQKAYDNDWKNIWIFEDDVMLHENFIELMEANISILNTIWWEMALFGSVAQYDEWDKGKKHRKLFYSDKKYIEAHNYPEVSFFATHCYAVRRYLYDEILKKAKTYKGAIDNLYVDRFHKKSVSGMLIFNPSVAIQHPCYLTIEEQMNPNFKGEYI